MNIPNWLAYVAPSVVVIAYWVGRINGFRIARDIAAPALDRIRKGGTS